ncbi:MAG: homoserine kinase [Pseudomonadota bacterium]
MAVYTEVDQAAADRFARGFGIGPVTACDAILEGVENSNYRLTTETAPHILTLFEKRVDPDDLPFFLGLLEHLAARGVPCPVPLKNSAGKAVARLAGRPAALLSFLPGTAVTQPGPQHCAAVGTMLAVLHREASDYPASRPNALSPSGWRTWLDRSNGAADTLKPGLTAFMRAELETLTRLWPTDLPRGIIHGDLFPDNVFFDEDRLSGVIDFYFAANDFLAFDLAVCINAWCFDDHDRLQTDRSAALISGYSSVRQMEKDEVRALPLLCRGAAMRFFVTRVYDWSHTPPSAHVTPKDPMEYYRKLLQHKAVEADMHTMDPYT